MASAPTPDSPIMSVDHVYIRPAAGSASRSPCPGLNTLANHGYIRRDGTGLSFFEVLHAVTFVYNFSYPLALLLTVAGFVTCGEITWPDTSASHTSTPTSWTASFPSLPRLTLDLSALSARGALKIAHDAAFVHPNGAPSTSPDSTLLALLLARAASTRDAAGHHKHGLGLRDLAHYHAERTRVSPEDTGLHKQIATAECSLVWQVLRARAERVPADFDDETAVPMSPSQDWVVPTSRLEQWFGEERLPDGWWDRTGARPSKAIGLIHSRVIGSIIDRLG